jgi:hypothetical protein
VSRLNVIDEVRVFNKTVVWGIGKVHAGFLWGNLRIEDHLEDTFVDGRIILKWAFEMRNGRSCTGSLCLRTGTGDGVL